MVLRDHEIRYFFFPLLWLIPVCGGAALPSTVTLRGGVTLEGGAAAGRGGGTGQLKRSEYLPGKLPANHYYPILS